MSVVTNTDLTGRGDQGDAGADGVVQDILVDASLDIDVTDPEAPVMSSTGDLSGTDGLALPTADPHVAGRWWDNAGTLTKSAG